MSKSKIVFIVCISSCIIIVILFVISTDFPEPHFQNQRYLSLSEQSPNFMKRNKNWDNFCKVYKREEGIEANSYYFYKDKRLISDSENLSNAHHHPSKQGLLWCKVPKAGSTTITYLFLRLAGVKVDEPGNSTIESIVNAHTLLRKSYETIDDLEFYNLMRFALKLLVVRDPFERILSAYRDKLEDFQRYDYKYERFSRLMVLSKGNSSTQPQQPQREPTWKEFISYLIRTHPSSYDTHWSPISRLCSPCTMKYDYIIRLDSFNEQIQFPLAEVGIYEPNLGWSHKTKSSDIGTIQKYFSQLTLGDLKKLYLIYKSDFDLFDYDPNKYFRLATQ